MLCCISKGKMGGDRGILCCQGGELGSYSGSSTGPCVVVPG